MATIIIVHLYFDMCFEGKECDSVKDYNRVNS